MTPRQIFCIVEGDGEVRSIRSLIHRVDPSIVVPRPFLVHRNRLDRELDRAIEFGVRRTGSSGTILVLLDADDDPPCRLGPELLARAKASRPDVKVGVVLAKREFEAWFLGSLESLRGQRGLPVDCSPPAEPEAVAGAKEYLGQLMGRRYSPTTDQPAFAAKFDLELAATRCPSFAKFLREVRE